MKVSADVAIVWPKFKMRDLPVCKAKAVIVTCAVHQVCRKVLSRSES